MRNDSIRIVAVMIIFTSLVCSLGCGSGTAPTPNASNVQPASTPAAKDASCDGTDVNDKVTKLNAAIDKRFKDDPEFKKQYEGQNGNLPTFRFWVVNNGGIIELKIKGKVSGKNEKGTSKLEGILDIIDEFLDKKSCIQRVTLVPGAITSVSEAAPTSAGFEWTFCESPMIECSNGVCVNNPPGCGTISANTNGNSSGTPTPNPVKSP